MRVIPVKWLDDYRVEITYDADPRLVSTHQDRLKQHGWFGTLEYNGEPQARLTVELKDWFKANQPETRYDEYQRATVMIVFPTPKAAALFKLFWL